MFTLTAIICGIVITVLSGGVALPFVALLVLGALVSDAMGPAEKAVVAHTGGPKSATGCGAGLATITLLGAVAILLALAAAASLAGMQ